MESTATASTNISNYFCALWPKRRIELSKNVVEISQSSPRRFFTSHFRLLFLLLFNRLRSTLMVSWLIHSSGSWIDVEFSAGILVSQITELQISILQIIRIFQFRKLQISIFQIISIFPFRKLQISILQIISIFHISLLQIIRTWQLFWNVVNKSVRNPCDHCYNSFCMLYSKCNHYEVALNFHRFQASLSRHRRFFFTIFFEEFLIHVRYFL